MIATLARILGPRHLQLAEDAVQEALRRALETWKFGALPDNPSAWLMRAARNQAVDVIRRHRYKAQLAPEVARYLESEWTLVPTMEALFDESAIRDDELRLMFSCCDPELPPEAQIAVVLKWLCGFGVREIAQAFLTTTAAIEKRLTRARTVLAQRGSLYEVRDSTHAVSRIPSVREALYLLFSEGYHGGHQQEAIREDLCREAVRLAIQLTELDPAVQAESSALVALMCLHLARLSSRRDEAGSLLMLAEQDRSTWDATLITEGMLWLGRSATGDHLSAFHIEAAIAARHCTAPSVALTDWADIRRLYDALLALCPSPVVALNRAIAVGMAEGPERGIAEVMAIRQRARLARYPFFEATLGELNARAGRTSAAEIHFHRAAKLARNPSERSFLERRGAECRRARDVPGSNEPSR